MHAGVFIGKISKSIVFRSDVGVYVPIGTWHMAYIVQAVYAIIIVRHLPKCTIEARSLQHLHAWPGAL